MNFETFKQELKKATAKSFLRLTKIPDLYAFGLLSDENCQTILPVANTLSYLKTAREEYQDLQSLICKYSPDEWDYNLFDNMSEFKKLNRLLSIEDEKERDKHEFETFQQKFYTICNDVLLELKRESFFDQNFGKDIFLIFSVSEYEFEKNKLEEMIEKLNSKAYSSEYLGWISTWGY